MFSSLSKFTVNPPFFLYFIFYIKNTIKKEYYFTFGLIIYLSELVFHEGYTRKLISLPFFFLFILMNPIPFT
jgi:hypothetical protein